jgi:hypothetical protein
MASQRPVERTEEWAELELLLEWPEQVEYERIRSAAIFGSSVAERSRQTGTPETTLRRRITRASRATGCVVCSSLSSLRVRTAWTRRSKGSSST